MILRVVTTNFGPSDVRSIGGRETKMQKRMDMPGIEPGTLCNHDDCEADIIPLDHMPCSVVNLSQIAGLYW